MVQIVQTNNVFSLSKEIVQIRFNVNVIDGQIPLKIFGLMNECLNSEYLDIDSVFSSKKDDSYQKKVYDALCRLEQMEA